MSSALADRVREVLNTVPDPEMPPVTIADLGMIAGIRTAEGSVEVDLIPTFSGCPATELIARDVAAAVRGVAGVDDVEVRFVAQPVWSPERISAEGRDKLRAFGIAPPGETGALVQLGNRTSMSTEVTCPLCTSTQTVMDSPFGPTPCRSTHYCNTCENPFEAIKP